MSMKLKEVFVISFILVFIFLISCVAPAPQQPEEEKVTIKQVEPSQVVLPQVGQAVATIEVQGETEGSFVAEIMNQMVARLKGNASAEAGE